MLAVASARRKVKEDRHDDGGPSTKHKRQDRTIFENAWPLETDWDRKAGPFLDLS